VGKRRANGVVHLLPRLRWPLGWHRSVAAGSSTPCAARCWTSRGRDGLIRRNVALAVKRPGIKSADARYLSAEEACRPTSEPPFGLAREPFPIRLGVGVWGAVGFRLADDHVMKPTEVDLPLAQSKSLGSCG
jgi:hypothetical protein